MPRLKSQKMQLATELWQTMPKVKLGEFVTAFEQAHNMPISQPAAYLAKKYAGLTRKNKKAKQPAESVTIEQMQLIHELTRKYGGIKEVRKQLARLKAISDAAGGLDRLERCLDMIEELKRK